METIVKCEAVKKDYGQGDVVVHALRGVDLTLEAGAMAAVAGPSGSGKSTLLNIISGLDKPTEGRITVAGQDVTGMSRSQMSRLRLERIGFVFQAYNLLPVLTAFENAEYVMLMQGVSADERHAKVMSLLEQVGLKGMEHRYPRELSGGQQQRVAIARAIAAEPRLVLADEPTANVDSKTGAALMDLLAQLNEEKGVTFLFSTHDRSVMKRAKRLILLRDGQIVENGTAEMLDD